MNGEPESISDLATPAEYAEFHGLSLANTYRLIAAKRLRAVNTSAGVRATWRLPLEQFPEPEPGLEAPG